MAPKVSAELSSEQGQAMSIQEDCMASFDIFPFLLNCDDHALVMVQRIGHYIVQCAPSRSYDSKARALANHVADTSV